MAGQDNDAYVALLAARGPQIRALLEQGCAFVTNAFYAGAAPPGLKVKTDKDHVRSLHQAGYQVAVTTGYDEQGHPRPTLRAMWRKKP